MTTGKYKRKRQRRQTQTQQATARATFLKGKEMTENEAKATKQGKEHAAHEEDPSWWQRFVGWAKRKSSFTDWCIAAFTLVLSCAAVYQFIITGWQLDVMRKDQRPWLTLDFIGDTNFQPNQPLGGVLRVVNSGKTPAREIRGDIVVERIKNGEEPKMNYPLPHGGFTTGLLTPGTPRDVPFTRLRNSGQGNVTESDPLTPSEYEDWQNTKAFFVMYATVYYKDFLNVQHWSRMCVFVAPAGKSGNFTAHKCTDYADVDTN